jgi:hypothetical protein
VFLEKCRRLNWEGKGGVPTLRALTGGKGVAPARSINPRQAARFFDAVCGAFVDERVLYKAFEPYNSFTSSFLRLRFFDADVIAIKAF